MSTDRNILGSGHDDMPGTAFSLPSIFSLKSLSPLESLRPRPEDGRKMTQQIERLKTELSDVELGHEFLERYVHELERHRAEEDVFRRFAFEDVNAGGAGTGPYIVSVYSELYEPLEVNEKVALRGWWHERMMTLATNFADLKLRLAKLSRTATAS